MLRIAICDDDAYDLKSIKDHTIELLNTLNLEYEIEEFSDGNNLLNSKISYDLILLDIEMDTINGVEIARIIRTFDKDTKIIFITNSTAYLKVGYTVSADRYFVKPIDKIEFNYELTNVLKHKIIDNKFLLNKKIYPYKIYFKDILYIEFYDRKTIIHRKNDSISTLLTLKEWLSMLENYDFSQPHRAYIINLRHIKDLQTNFVLLTNGTRIPLSRKYKAPFSSDYFISIGERL